MTDDDFQVSERARATVATSDLIDHEVVISNDSTFVINKKNKGVNRKNIENIIKQKDLNSSFLSMPYLSTEEMYLLIKKLTENFVVRMSLKSTMRQPINFIDFI